MSQHITRTEVDHVATLARLALTEEEADQFTAQLGAILDHAAQVSALDTSGVVPTAHPLPLVNVMRADEVAKSVERDEVLAAAPATQENRFLVPRILGESP